MIGVPERGEVRGFVPGLPSLTVDAAETSGREHFDADAQRDDASGSHRRRGGPRACEDDRKVAHARLYDVVTVRDGCELVVGQSHVDFTVDNGDSGRRCAVGGDDGLDLSGHADVLRLRQSVTDDGGFQCDDGCSASNGFLDARMKVNGRGVRWHVRTLLVSGSMGL